MFVLFSKRENARGGKRSIVVVYNIKWDVKIFDLQSTFGEEGRRRRRGRRRARRNLEVFKFALFYAGERESERNISHFDGEKF